MKKLIYLSLIILFLYGCDSSGGNNQLLNDIDKYYSLEKNKKWSELYDRKSRRYRDAYEKEYFVEKMGADSSGWKFISYSIENIKVKNNIAFVKITYEDNPPIKFKQKYNIGDEVNTLMFTENTVWVLEDGHWLNERTGKRQYLTLGDI